MNQLSGERARRAGGGCWNAPGAARPGRREALRSVPPRRSRGDWRVPGEAGLALPFPRAGAAAGIPNFVPVPPPARALQGGPGAGPGTVREDLFSSYCDYAIYSLKKGKQNKTCPGR